MLVSTRGRRPPSLLHIRITNVRRETLVAVLDVRDPVDQHGGERLKRVPLRHRKLLLPQALAPRDVIVALLDDTVREAMLRGTLRRKGKVGVVLSLEATEEVDQIRLDLRCATPAVATIHIRHADFELVGVAVGVHHATIDNLTFGWTNGSVIGESLCVEGSRVESELHNVVQLGSSCIGERFLERQRERVAIGSPRCRVPF